MREPRQTEDVLCQVLRQAERVIVRHEGEETVVSCLLREDCDDALLDSTDALERLLGHLGWFVEGNASAVATRRVWTLRAEGVRPKQARDLIETICDVINAMIEGE